MALTPPNHFKQYPFVDRESYIQNFIEAVNNIGHKEYSVLVYYGVAGIGKTSLRKELPKYLDEHYIDYPNKKLVWASINLQLDKYREKTAFLVSLKNELQRKSKIKFPAFEIAHAIYWKKANPEIPLRKETYLFFEGDNAFDDFFGVIDQIPYFSIVPATARLLKSSQKYFKKWWKTIGEAELSQISEMEPMEIEETLPYFWAQDLNSYLENTSKSAVLFIDTYEALWENHRSDGNSRDKWIREELIPRLSKKVLWVICGKEALGWEELKSEWGEYLTQYEVEELIRKYCMEYLEKQGITDKEIQEIIFKGSKGVPYYLELSTNTYVRIVENGDKPKPEDFGDNYQEITDRFLRYLSSVEKDALKILSVPHFWDDDLFKYLVKMFNTGYPTNHFEDLCSFSFINTSEKNKYQMHKLMQESLQKTQKANSVIRIHKAIHEYYSNKLENIDIKLITPEHEIALIEAFYHAKESLETEDMFNWFIAVSDPFDRAAFWQLIVPMYEEMLQILETKLGSEDNDVAITLNMLAEAYRKMGDYEKVLPLNQRALEITKKIFGSENSNVATLLNNRAVFYRHMGKYYEALPLYQRALEIREKVYGPEHQDVAGSLNNLASLYLSMGYYYEALPLYQRALEIRENVFGPEHLLVAASLNNLGGIYDLIGDYEKALLFIQRAYEIIEIELGPEHPDVAASLNNLAGIYDDMGNCDKALSLNQRALDIQEMILDPQHPDVATSLNNLGSIYENMGNYEKAFLHYQKALDIRENVLGPQHPEVARTLNNIARLSRKMGNYKKIIYSKEIS